MLVHFPQATFQQNTSHAAQQGSDVLVEILEAPLPKYDMARSKVPTPLIFPFKFKLPFLWHMHTAVRWKSNLSHLPWNNNGYANVPVDLLPEDVSRTPHPPHNCSYVESSTLTRQY